MLIALSLDTGNNNNDTGIKDSRQKHKKIEESQGEKFAAKPTLKEAYREFGQKLRIKTENNAIKEHKKATRRALKMENNVIKEREEATRRAHEEDMRILQKRENDAIKELQEAMQKAYQDYMVIVHCKLKRMRMKRKLQWRKSTQRKMTVIQWIIQKKRH